MSLIILSFTGTEVCHLTSEWALYGEIIKGIACFKRLGNYRMKRNITRNPTKRDMLFEIIKAVKMQNGNS